jgi:hypothetical protein
MACNLRLLMELENCTLRKKRTRCHLWIGVLMESWCVFVETRCHLWIGVLMKSWCVFGKKNALVNFEEVFEIQEMLFSAHFFLRLLYYLCIAH